MSEQSINQPGENEISIKDIIDFLLESWKVIIVIGFIGGLLAVGYAFVIPPKYQAIANIQVAKVAGSDVETGSTLVEKLKMPMYFSTASYAACNVINSIEPGQAIATNLKPTLSKTAPIISFSYIENSREDAQKCLESVFNDVRINQNLLSKPILENKKNQLTNLKQKLDAAERIIKASPNKNLSFDLSDSKLSAMALLLTTTLSLENEIKDLRAQINDLEFTLAEPQTMQTFLVTPIYAPKQKVSPRRTRILMGGVMAGMFLGLLYMISKRTWHAYKTSN